MLSRLVLECEKVSSRESDGFLGGSLETLWRRMEQETRNNRYASSCRGVNKRVAFGKVQ